MKRLQFPVAAYVALVFLSGVLVGAFGLRLYMVRSVKASVAAHQPTAEEFRRQYLNEMQSRLGLSGDQVGKINSVLDNTKVCFHRIHQKIEPEIKALKEQQVAEIRAILTPAQQPKYDQWRAERERQGK
jgi:ATP-dependent Clp protease ATP-binding subunit ClpA